MKYNTELSKLIIPEYGRHIHQIIEKLSTIKDKKKRNEQAEIVIQIMGNLNPHLRDVNDFKHKLWDHLFIMSDYKLDVESPYPIPQKKEKRERPKIINNTQGTVKHRHYGKFVIDMLKKAPELKNEDTKNKLIISIANQMKRSYVNWNKSNVLDDVIFNEIEEISNGNIKIPQNTVLENIQVQHHKQHSQYKSGARRKTNHRQKKYK
tara:strand:+ start:2141 stop:2761 length:621 start_codon:yes stop_codon:yes gene_type:complete